MTTDARAAAEAWLADDPDPTRGPSWSSCSPAARDQLALRFAGRLQFGTAGLRGELGAGPLRMNRVIVRRAAAGLPRYLLDAGGGAATRGVVIGCDARRKSDVFAEDTAAVMAGAGIKALPSCRSRCPTPVLAVVRSPTSAAPPG